MALAGIQWKTHSGAIEKARAALDPTRYLQVRSEDFCEQPLETCRRVSGFAELESPSGFIRDVERTTIRDMTQRWRKDLSPEQQALRTDVREKTCCGMPLSSRR